MKSNLWKNQKDDEIPIDINNNLGSYNNDNYDNNGNQTELYYNQIINNDNKPMDIENIQETLNNKITYNEQNNQNYQNNNNLNNQLMSNGNYGMNNINLNNTNINDNYRMNKNNLNNTSLIPIFFF